MTPAKPKARLTNEPKTTPPNVQGLTYEQALAELEQIVASLEASTPVEENKLSLDEALALFERGQALTRHCIDLLDKAELRVRQLSGDTLEDLPSDD